MSTKLTRCVAFALFIILSSCRNADEQEGAFDPGSLLSFVPADTPYIYASVNPVDTESYAALSPHMDSFLRTLADIISVFEEIEATRGDPGQAAEPGADTLVAAPFEEPGGPALDEKTKALIDKIQAMMSVSALEEIGLNRNTLFALYGDEFRPVLRVRSDNVDALNTAILDLLGDFGLTSEEQVSGEQVFNRFSDESWSLLLAMTDKDVVLSMVPADASPEDIARALGVVLPETSLGESGKLANIARKAGYLPQGLGYLDIKRSISLLLELDPSSPVAELNDLWDPAQDLSPECVSEIIGLAEAVPMYRFGLTELAPDRLSMEYLLELTPEMAAGLASMAAPVPGLGEDLGGVFFLGYSFDLFAAKQFALDQIAALEADPFECEHLSLVQGLVDGAKEAVSGSLPPMVSSLKGAAMVLDEIGEFDLEDLEMVPFKARMVTSLDNPLSLLAMSGMVLPALASVPLDDNGEPVRLPDGAIPQIDEPVFIAVGESAVSLTVGSDEGDAARALLNENVNEVPTLYTYGVDMGIVMGMLSKLARAAGDSLDPEDELALKVFDTFSTMNFRYMESVQFPADGLRYGVTLMFD